MTKNENEIISDWKRIDDEYARRVCELLNEHEVDVRNYLAEMVAALCEVGVDDLMTNEKKLHCNHARWLFWYAYRYMTNDTLEQMANLSEKCGRRFTLQGIGYSINRMASLIASDTIWTKRWILIKKVIKARDKAIDIDFSEQIEKPLDKVVVRVPRELKEKVEINYE